MMCVVFRSRCAPKCAHLLDSRKRLHLHKRVSIMPTDERSLDHYASCSRFPAIFFLFLFLLISTVPLTIPVTYKGTQFRRAELFQSLSRATLCPVYRAYSYAVHRCIHRPAIPPTVRFPYSRTPAPRSSTSVIVTEAH